MLFRVIHSFIHLLYTYLLTNLRYNLSHDFFTLFFALNNARADASIIGACAAVFIAELLLRLVPAELWNSHCIVQHDTYIFTIHRNIIFIGI